MVKACAVRDCPSGRNIKSKKKETSCSVSFFQPNTPSKLQRWTQSLGIPLKKTDYICQFHFTEKDINMYQKIVIGNVIHLHPVYKKTLTKEALPTIEHQSQLHFKQQQDGGQEQLQQLKQEQQQQWKQEQQQQWKQEQQHQPKQEQQQQPKQEQKQQPKQEQNQQLKQEQQQQPEQGQQQQPEQDQQWQPKQEQQQQPEQDQLLQSEQQFEHMVEHHQQEQTPEITEPITYIKKKLSVLPEHWLYVEKPNEVEFIRIDLTRMQIQNRIILNKDFSISVIFSNNERMNLDDKISSPDEIFKYLKSIEKWQLCVGVESEKQRYSKQCKGVIIGDEAYQRTQTYPRCKSCRVLRKRLQNYGSRKRHSKNIIRQSQRLKIKVNHHRKYQVP